MSNWFEFLFCSWKDCDQEFLLGLLAALENWPNTESGVIKEMCCDIANLPIKCFFKVPKLLIVSYF